MLIRDIMTTSCAVCTAGSTIQQAARAMAKEDIGFIPIAENNKLIGSLTDRDIVVRGVATGIDTGATLVTDIMSDQVFYCMDDQDCLQVAANMAEIGVRRLPVVDRNKNLVGTVSLGDIAQSDTPEAAGIALAGITRAA